MNWWRFALPPARPIRSSITIQPSQKWPILAFPWGISEPPKALLDLRHPEALTGGRFLSLGLAGCRTIGEVP